jgi:hypothetical protein
MATAVAATGGVGGPPVARGVDRLLELPEGENPGHDEDHGPADRQGGTQPRHGGPDQAVHPGAAGPATVALNPVPDRCSPRRRAECGPCRPLMVGACAGGRKSRPGPAEDRLAPDDDQPRQGRELSAQQRHPPLEPRLRDSFLDLRQAVAGRLNRIQCRMQYAAENVVVVAIWSGHASRSRPPSAPLALVMSATPGRSSVRPCPGRYGS